MQNKQDIIQHLAQTPQDRMLLAHALDKLTVCLDRNYITHTWFLDLRERALVSEAVKLAEGTQNMLLWGGFATAERTVASFFPAYMTEQDAMQELPLTVLRAKKSRADTLSHRDYLGALMGLQIERRAVGDILVQEDGADLVILQEIAPFLLLNLEKAGKWKLELTEIPIEQIRPVQEDTQQYTANVASLRLDNILAAIFRLSRTQAQAFIAQGCVFVNFLPAQKPERLLFTDDRITLRGQGRAQIKNIGGQSRKGRQFFTFTCTKQGK